ncbi:SPOR domain-containing protein [Glaciecola siphonariae]|uniref:SPOR domain-containing protein n=1 Tax=Glaciecola siphonariae TaxID=521012 RepID=A0ABV9LU73_9ALTE
MNAALQNRLVGTIIVVALVVILLPEVLDGEKSENTQEFVEIPQAPNALVIEQAEPFPQEQLSQQTLQNAEIVDETALDDIDGSQIVANEAKEDQPANLSDTSSASEVPQAPAQTQTTPAQAQEVEIDVKDSGYVVQLGSFRYEKNVNELITTLKQAGYRAYSQPVRTSVGVLNKVFVGPELERERLEQALPHLQELTNLKGKITAFEVSAE